MDLSPGTRTRPVRGRPGLLRKGAGASYEVLNA